MALDWLCDGTSSILDFGCGNGVWLFKCYLRGTKEHIGIDISHEGIRVAKEMQKMMEYGEFTFTVGGVEALEGIPPFITEDKIKEWNIKIIDGNFLDDGLFLWNQTTEEWEKLFLNYFTITSYKEIYYPKYDQYNRLFLLCNN